LYTRSLFEIPKFYGHTTGVRSQKKIMIKMRNKHRIDARGIFNAHVLVWKIQRPPPLRKLKKILTTA
jgi:alpha-D-ribose 1-methylphosphonate 5-phosphate C-P lyase